MAAKKRRAKPKGIVDDIAKGIQSLVGATQPKITDPQSLAEFKQTTKNILKTGAQAGDIAITGGLGGSLAKNVVAPGAKVASPKTRSKAQNQGFIKFGVDVGVTAASVGAGAGVAKIVKSTNVAQKALSKLLPKEIGVHHSVTGVSGQPFKGVVKPSGSQGLTAMDQIAGNSYFWNTKGKGGAMKAASEANFQTKNIADNWLLDSGQRASAYITKIPKGKATPDLNLPNSAARTVVGSQKIVQSIVSSAPTNPVGMTAFSSSDIQAIASAVNKAKAAEIAKSGIKFGGVAAVPAGGAAIASKTKASSKPKSKARRNVR